MCPNDEALFMKMCEQHMVSCQEEAKCGSNTEIT